MVTGIGVAVADGTAVCSGVDSMGELSGVSVDTGTKFRVAVGWTELPSSLASRRRLQALNKSIAARSRKLPLL